MTDVELAPEGAPPATFQSANPVAPLKPREREALKASIREHGVQVPILVDEATGEVIDGFHRLEICRELGIECPSERRRFAPGEARLLQLLLNVQRRQLDDLSAGLLYRDLARERGALTGTGVKTQTGWNVDRLAEEVGVSSKTYYRRVKLANLMDDPANADLREALLRDEMSTAEALALAESRQGRPASPAPVAPPQPRVQQAQRSTPLDRAREAGFREGFLAGAERVLEKTGYADGHGPAEQVAASRRREAQRMLDELAAAEAADAATAQP